ncbi:MAG: hypothetical protein J4A00_08000 [Gammaproteobacteria bacterium]|nr:hypothetical protein [Gammaproteobacteria bacterium]
MKTIVSALILAFVLITPAFAENHHQKGDGAEKSGMGGMMMGMMSHEEMAAMHTKMQEMQAVMEKIKQEKDPDKRHQLMQEHMASMQMGMRMMGGKGGMMKKGKGMAAMQLEDRMEMMETGMKMMGERVDMMQMMMGQMMDHQAQAGHRMHEAPRQH